MPEFLPSESDQEVFPELFDEQYDAEKEDEFWTMLHEAQHEPGELPTVELPPMSQENLSLVMVGDLFAMGHRREDVIRFLTYAGMDETKATELADEGCAYYSDSFEGPDS